MPRFSKTHWKLPGQKTSDTGYMRRTPWPFSFPPERFGALPLFPQYWRFLPYLQNAEYICGWLYLLRQSQNGLYIPWIAAASFSMWRERPVRITCHRHGSGRNWQKHRGNRSSVNGILMPQGRKKASSTDSLSVPPAFLFCPIIFVTVSSTNRGLYLSL